MEEDSGVAAVSEVARSTTGRVTVAAQLHKSRQDAAAAPAASLCMVLPFFRRCFIITYITLHHICDKSKKKRARSIVWQQKNPTTIKVMGKII